MLAPLPLVFFMLECVLPARAEPAARKPGVSSLHDSEVLMSAIRAIAVGLLLIGCLATEAVAGNVFVLPANTFDTTVAVFTDSPFQSSGTIAVPPGALAVFARPDGSRYYVVSASSTDTLLVMNSALTSVLKRVDLGSPARAAGLSPDGTRLLILAGGLHVFDVTTPNDDNITPSPAPEVGVNPGALAFSLDSKSAFILSSTPGLLSKYDLSGNFVDGALELNGSPAAVATAPTGVLLVSATNVVYEVDPITATVRTRIAVNGLPGKAAFTPDGKYALLPNGAAFVATGLGFLLDMQEHAVAGILPRSGNTPEPVLDQLAAANDGTFYGVSTSTRRMVRVKVDPLALETTSFVLSSKTDVRALTISAEQPQATYAFLSSGAGVSRGRFDTGGVEDGTVAVTPGRLVLAGAASMEVPTDRRIFNDAQSVVGEATTQPLILRVWDAVGRPVFDKEVQFSTLTEGVTFETPTTRTSLEGYALTRVTVPAHQGVIIVHATVQGMATPIEFRISVVGGGSTGEGGLVMYSGNGQVVPRGFPTEQPLRVRLTDAAGEPLVGATVTWELVSSSAFKGLVHPATSQTDIDGIAEGRYSGPVIVATTTSWVAEQVTANVPGFDPVTFVVTTIPEITFGTWAPPTYNLLTPLAGATLTGQAGQILTGAIRVRARAIGGTDTGRGIPNVGVDLVSDLDPSTNPTASCVGEGNAALSDTTGITSCDVRLGGVVGGPARIRVRVGGGGRDAGTEYSLFVTVTPGPAGQITILGGNNQTGGPNTILPASLSAEISDGFGHVLPGTAVTWEAVTPGAVSILTSSSVADAAGRVSAQVRLGATAGQVVVRLRAGSAEALFTLTVNIPIASLNNVSGSGQSALVNQAFAAPLVVEARDQQGQPVAGVSVVFTLVSGPATLGGGTVVTGANGRASITATAGAVAGPVVIRATLLEFVVTFNLTVGIPVSSMTKVGGDGQSAVVNQDFGAPLMVELRDQQGALVQSAAVTFAVISGPATLVGNSTVTTAANGRASVTVRAGAAAGAVVVRATSFTLTTTFNLTVLPPGPGLSHNNIRNAISGDLGVTPGGIVAIYGQGIAPSLQGSVVANGGYLIGPLPTILAGVEVLFGTTNAPIYHVTNANGQQWVAVQAPFTLTAGGTTSVTVRVGGGSATVEGVDVKNYQPGIFETLGPAGRRWAVLTKEDGSYVTADNPVRRGVDRRLRMYCAGLGQANPALTTNGVGVPGQTLLAQLAPYVLTTDGSAARVVSAEPMVGMVGLYVVTIEIPAALQTGSDQLLVLGVAGQGGAFTYNVSSAIARVE